MSGSRGSPNWRYIIAASALLSASATWAQIDADNSQVRIAEHVASCGPDCVEVGQWQLNLGIGVGARSNPLAAGEPTPLILLPEVSFYGHRFFLRNLDMGFTLVETPRHQLNLLATPSYDQMYFNRWDPLNLTFQGGASAAGSYTAAPPGAGRPQTYLSVSSPSTSWPSSGDIDADAGEGAGSPSAPAPISTRDAISFDGTFSGVAVIEINGTIVTSSAILNGAEGNAIDVRVESGRVSIDGISASDALSLRSKDGVRLTSVTGDARLGGSEMPSGVVLAVDVANDAFIISGEALGEQAAPPEGAADERISVPFDAVGKRRMSGLAGLEYSYTANWASVHLQALQDFTNTHHGHEYRVALVFPLELPSQRLALTLGANHKSAQVLDYYYGIDEAEAADPAWQYQITAAGTETLVRLDWQMPVARQWTLRAKLQYLGLSEQMTRSPLVTGDYVLSAFVGGVYHF